MILSDPAKFFHSTLSCIVNIHILNLNNGGKTALMWLSVTGACVNPAAQY